MKFIGIDIGGTKCAVVLGNEKGDILEKHKFSTASYMETLDKILISVEQLGKCDAIGISCGGPLDSKKGIIISPPNLTDWRNVEIVKILNKRFNVPVFLKNDADAGALAEWTYGAGRGTDNMIFLTFGTGMGAGMILNGQLYSGTCDCAGEVGHIRMSDTGPIGFGKAGSFEGYCSGGGIAQLGELYKADKLLAGKSITYHDSIGQITAKSIAEAAEKGDKDALEIYSQCGKILGKGLAILIDVLNPQKIIIGSIFQRCGHLMRSEMERQIANECLEYTKNACEIVPSQLGESIGDMAAICVAKYSMNRQ